MSSLALGYQVINSNSGAPDPSKGESDIADYGTSESNLLILTSNPNPDNGDVTPYTGAVGLEGEYRPLTTSNKNNLNKFIGKLTSTYKF
jgi:hypothetical protein